MNTKDKKLRKGYVYVEVVAGVEGPSLYIGDDDTGERIAGPKPWGGGRTLHRFEVKVEDLEKAIHSYVRCEE